MKIKLSPQQVQRAILTPLMQQSIEVLLLPIMELNTAIEQELQNNPLLEIVEESPELPPENSDYELKYQLNAFSENLDSILYHHNNDENADHDNQQTLMLSKEVSLEDYLMQQLRIEISDPLKLKIGELLIGNINEDGYCTLSREEIAKLANVDNLELINEVLNIIKNFDPIGVASYDLKECLLQQIKYKHTDRYEKLYKMIDQHLEDLGRKKYLEIARKLNVSLEEVKELAQLVASLEPKPARNYRPINTNIYIKPDVTILKTTDNEYQIVIHKENIPRIRINPQYKNMLNQNNLKEEEKLFIREKIKRALNFMKSIEQRSSTLREITKFILSKQKSFFDNDDMHLVPMNLKDVALVLNRNESTISRAVNNKYIDTPKGLFPIKFFFACGIPNTDPHTDTTDNISSRSVKEEIRQIIDEENKISPLSDQEIQHLFKKRGMMMARRTVSKYRQGLGILPSHLRKE